MVNRIQIKRGNLSDIPILSVGEFGFATDVEQVYIGTSSSNIKNINFRRSIHFTCCISNTWWN